MKKVLSLFMALAMILSLAACGQKAEPAPAEDPQPEQQEQQEPVVEPEPEAEPEPEPTVPTFGASRETFLNALKASVDLPETPEVSESDGKTAYTYAVADGVSCVLYADTTTDELASVFLYGDSSKWINGANSEAAKTYGEYAAVLTGLFADSSELDAIDAALAIAETPITDSAMNDYAGHDADFSYIVNGGKLMLLISPPLT